MDGIIAGGVEFFERQRTGLPLQKRTTSLVGSGDEKDLQRAAGQHAIYGDDDARGALDVVRHFSADGLAAGGHRRRLDRR